MNRNIVVAGSLNADLVQRVERFPSAGETVVGSDLSIVPGGKGANQACAAALLGGNVKMIGQVGNDPFGPILIDSLARANVDVSCIQVSATATGTASILVSASGENLIVISPGANGTLTPDAIAGRLAAIEPESILLTQLEVPLATTELCLRMARERKALTIFDPAPAQALPPELLASVDFLTPNQTEAALLLGSNREIESYEDAEQASHELLARGPSVVILKLGRLGAVVATRDALYRVPGFAVKALDSTAAGDTFNGALAAALAEGRPLEQAIQFANAAGAISVTRHGAQSSIPHRAEVDAFLGGHV